MTDNYEKVDYKKMYFTLFNAVTDAISELENVRQAIARLVPDAEDESRFTQENSSCQK